MLWTTQSTGGVDECGFYLLAAFSYNRSDQVEEMIRLLNDPGEIAEVVERTDDHAVLKIRPDVPGL